MTEHNGTKQAGWLMQVQTTLVGVATLILTAGIPWAYVVGNKLAVIETSLVSSGVTISKLESSASEGIRQHERRITQLETEMVILKQLGEQARNRAAQKQ